MHRPLDVACRWPARRIALCSAIDRRMFPRSSRERRRCRSIWPRSWRYISASIRLPATSKKTLVEGQCSPRRTPARRSASARAAISSISRSIAADVLGRQPRHRQPHGHHLERLTHLVRLDELLVRERADDGAPPRSDRDEALGGEPAERFADRPAADAERPRRAPPRAARCRGPAGPERISSRRCSWTRCQSVRWSRRGGPVDVCDSAVAVLRICIEPWRGL